MQKKNVITWVLIALFTCGIGSLIWWYSLAEDIKRASKDEQAPSGIVTILLSLVTCGIYGWIWVYQSSVRLSTVDPTHTNNAVLNLILGIFTGNLVAIALMQNQLNNIIDARTKNPQPTPVI